MKCIHHWHVVSKGKSKCQKCHKSRSLQEHKLTPKLLVIAVGRTVRMKRVK